MRLEKFLFPQPFPCHAAAAVAEVLTPLSLADLSTLHLLHGVLMHGTVLLGQVLLQPRPQDSALQSYQVFG